MKHPYSTSFLDRLRAKKLVIMFSSMFTCLGIWAQDVNYSQAKVIATDFFKSHGVKIEAVVPQKAKRKTQEKTEANSPYYIFNSDDASAFVVVSGDSRTQQVLAYSTEGAFDEENVAPGAQFFLDMYEDYINAIQNVEIKPVQAKTPLIDGNGYRLNTALWDQNADDFWGSQCPTIDNAHTYAGCVATAMGILMRHYEWAKGSGSKTNDKGSLDSAPTADFGSTDYNIASIPTNQEEDDTWSDAQKKSVAKLLYHCGVAANMNYGISESGTSLNAGMIGLYRYFGYTLGRSVSFDGDIAKWVNIIKSEIDGGNPVLYEGNSTTNGGHAFICEGYDNENRLYFNYGWSGASNGYYTVYPANPDDNSTYPTDLNRFPNYQGATIGIRPYKETTPQTMLDLIFCYNDGTRERSGVSVNGTVQREVTFNVTVSNILNVSDRNIPSFKYGVAIHREDSQSDKPLSGFVNMQNFSPASWSTGSYSFPCKLPYNYKPSEGDYIYCCYSEDDGTTWHMLPSYNPEYAKVKVTDIYNPASVSHFRISNGEHAAIEFYKTDYDYVNYNGDICYNFNFEGRDFGVSVYNLVPNLSIGFNGELAVFLCDKDGNKIKAIGQKNFSINYGSYWANYVFTCCNMNSDTEITAGDNLRLFSRYQGEETWMPVECETPELGKIALSQAIEFTTPYATLCSNYNLDFTGVTDICAYKATAKDATSIALERVTKVKAGEGIMLRGMALSEDKYIGNPVFTGTVSALNGNLFIGVKENGIVLNNDNEGHTNYVLGALNGVAGFYKANGVTVNAGQAYLSVPTPALNAPRCISISFSEDDETGLICIEEDMKADCVYTLQGIKVEKPEKGIYIINGKKFMKK